MHGPLARFPDRRRAEALAVQLGTATVPVDPAQVGYQRIIYLVDESPHPDFAYEVNGYTLAELKARDVA